MEPQMNADIITAALICVHLRFHILGRDSMRIRIIMILLVVVCPCAAPAMADDVILSSPDGRVQFRLLPGDHGRLQYAVMFKDKPVIETSGIGITVNSIDLADGVEIGTIDRYQVNETYPWYGGHSSAVDNCNGAKIAVTHVRSRTGYTLEIRAYNDGIAFRHDVPGEGTRVPDEATSFRLPAGSILWQHDLEDHYEAVHARKSLRAIPSGAWIAPPLTFKLPNDAGYGSITEGGLRAYSGMVLQADGSGGFSTRLGHSVPASYPFRLRYPQEVERLTHPASINGVIRTPWRVLMIGADLNALVNCDIVHNVAAPPDPKYFPDGIRSDWIKPGRSVWRYLDGGSEGTPEGMKAFSKLAGDLGFEYNLLEGFWAKWSEKELKDVVDYSREHGVRIIVWRSRSAFSNEKSIREMFEMLRRTGVAGVKIDFFDHEHKEVIDLYESILRLAAEYRLVVDFHGSNKPTGMERTWPNELGNEAIRGMEMAGPYAQHEVTLPFTRMLAGLADYTPVHFTRKLADTTWAHQVANAAILQAPLLVFGAHPANILANPAADIIKSLPSIWDETLVLPVSEIGQVAAFARRKGDTWFLAVTNGINARTVRVDLSFLGQGSYISRLVRDTCEPAAVRIENQLLTRSDSLFLDLRSGGGFVGRFTR
jgi:alpha-glucosidase